jgi:hypothetical protein
MTDDLSELLRVLKGKPKEILLPLLSEYANRWRHHGNQIWSTGAVFIPLSLSGVALGVGDPYRTLAVAIFSIILIWLWYAISLRLRADMEQNWQVYAAIESTLLKIVPPLRERGIEELLASKKQTRLKIKRIRLLVPLIITVAWLFTVILAFIL